MSWQLTRAAEIVPLEPPAQNGRSAGFARAELIGRRAGSLHTGLDLCTLAASGHIAPHLHSTEESFYVLAGNPVLTFEGCHYRLEPATCGLVPPGNAHAWRADGEARWIEVHAPAPRLGGPPDTFFTGEPPPSGEGVPVDIRDPRTRAFFRLQPEDMNLEALRRGARIDAPAVSASMATALLAYSGIAVKMLIDLRLDAVLHTMFMVAYEPGGIAQLHDHPLEESYYILEGAVTASADGHQLLLEQGDVFWTGVGCIHGFENHGPGPVRWLETQSPQPPSAHSYRFNRDWDYLAQGL